MTDPEPTYSFSVLSTHDQTPLDCRIYYPTKRGPISQHDDRRMSIKGAIVAHPYAPLGGSFDDAVVLAVTETLLDEGFVVGTFNFRGAGESAGRTSLTGKAEQTDYESFAGFMLVYLRHLLEADSSRDPDYDRTEFSCQPVAANEQVVNLVFAGYSYGSLVAARLRSVDALVAELQTAKEGTSEAAIISRARELAEETLRHMHSTPESRAGPESHRKETGTTSVTIGDEHAGHSKKRLSHDFRMHIKGGHHKSKSTSSVSATPAEDKTAGEVDPGHSEAPPTTTIASRYLLISPVLLPFTYTLCPPGSPTSMFSLGRSAPSTAAQLSYSDYPTLAVFGNSDVFTSSRRLKAWAEKQVKESTNGFEWAEIEGAGHFWREEGMMQALQQRVKHWTEGISHH